MRLALPGSPHLGYCTNIHPGESLADVHAAVTAHVPRVKALLGTTGPFGVGLRLSARAARELAAPGEIDRLRDALETRGLYVFTVNGFPHGVFHGAHVKERVYLPDWRNRERIRYTDELADELAALLPDGVDGSISTVPVSFGADPADPGVATRNLLAHAKHLFLLRERTGKIVELALEPEPGCLLETTEGAVRFFREHLFARSAVADFSVDTGLSARDAEAFLRRHLGVCLDACHLAVEFEDARTSVAAFRAAGIRVGKIQVTVALGVDLRGDPAVDGPVLRALERFDDGVYLHQVVERGPEGMIRQVDLSEAIARVRAAGPRGPTEWRVHFHVPVFAERLGPFRSTRPFLLDLLDIVRAEPVSPHLEVETYTFDVLPPEHREAEVDASIAREMRFTLDRLGVEGGRGES